MSLPTLAFDSWTPADLPPELIQYIVHLMVWADTTPLHDDPLPICKSKFWNARDMRGGAKAPDCVWDGDMVETGGFLARPDGCSLKVHSARNGRPIKPARPPGYRHACMNCSQVCRSWRNAIVAYGALWGDAVLLMPGHISLSVSRAKAYPLRLVNHRPLCTCLLYSVAPYIAMATEISFSMPAQNLRNHQVSETVFFELLSQSIQPSGSKLVHIDLRLSG